MNYLFKMYLPIICGIIKKQYKDFIKSQFGFRKTLVTQKVLFSLNICSKDVVINMKMFFSLFIDYEKALDKAKHNNIIDTLCSAGVH